jgi:diguanylate cyclase (GGDEF)-like protein
MRVRLFLALVTMFAIPLAIAIPVVYGTALRRGDVVLTPTIAIVALAMFLGLLTTWMARRILEPARRLENARVRLADAYINARALSLRDGLTGLGNHRAFQEELTRQCDLARRHNVSFALVLIDLDGFKSVNDSGGHSSGDQVLQQFGATIAPALRRSDQAFRVGGDEFAVLLPHTDADGAAIFVRRLLAASLEARGTGPEARAVSFSAGISSSAAAGADRDMLFRQADAALYWGKRHGRTCVTVFDPVRHDGDGGHSLPERSAAVARIAAMGGVRAVFQPIFDLRTGLPQGYEGLVRPLPGTGFSDPGTMFRAAEETGRTVELDLVCLDAVLARFSQLDLPGSVTLNLSPRTFESEDFSATTMLRLLARHHVAPERTVVEITEREAVEDIDRLARSINACRAAGMRIAADDVGAGNAGLRLLAQLRFDIVKIDLSLIQGGAVRASSQEVVRTLRDLADRWGALVIAEGIETPEQLVFVRSLDIHAGQGYLLGRPAEDPGRGFIDLDALETLSDDWLANRLRAVPA